MWIVMQQQWSFDHLDIVGTRTFGPFDTESDAREAAIEVTRRNDRDWRTATIHEVLPTGDEL
jgi:hypothetical protein